MRGGRWRDRLSSGALLAPCRHKEPLPQVRHSRPPQAVRGGGHTRRPCKGQRAKPTIVAMDVTAVKACRDPSMGTAMMRGAAVMIHTASTGWGGRARRGARGGFIRQGLQQWFWRMGF